MNDAAVLNEARSLIYALAPEFHAPVYLVSAAVAGPRFSLPGCFGYTSGLLDLVLQAHLEAACIWRGRGFAAIIDLEFKKQHRPGHQQFRMAVLATALHEFAHHIDRGLTLLPERNTLSPEKQAALDDIHRALERFDLSRQVEPGRARQQRDLHHGVNFLRLLIHLEHRAKRHGFLIGSDDLGLAGAAYGLSSAKNYRRALLDEPRELEDRPLMEILNTPCPTAFDELWRRDTQTCEN